MRIFAIELSSRFGSIALVEDGVLVAEKSWEENFKNRQQLFDALSEMKLDWNSIDVFSVGRGPGAFSGMRIAFSVANALAAPAGKPVYALNSGAAVAARYRAECTVVVGDARRNQVWAGMFKGAELEKEFDLMALDALQAFIPEEALVVSPDHDRLKELLAPFNTPENPEAAYPTAGWLGQLVHQRLENGVDSEPLEPLYMHPPVFIEPRFPA
ncbi:MAG TPA: tRNA (adenosine(37)-N6)-threonylcarbamoyltransferase complex dimerization subunit type 1 TsaB [Pontiella sp.]|nr:tRNA (adenosine(37)-N6)-threonylcarbamoyltransferase complex dimerization subunit type 1 TsaB [Pontiella sp.]